MSSGTTKREDIVNDITKRKVNGNYHKEVSNVVRNEYNGNDAFGDIIDDVLEGKQQTKEGKPIQLPYGHGEKYWQQGTEKRMHEFMANYNQLKMQPDGGVQRLTEMRELFGDEFCDTLDNMYKRLFKK